MEKKLKAERCPELIKLDIFGLYTEPVEFFYVERETSLSSLNR